MKVVAAAIRWQAFPRRSARGTPRGPRSRTLASFHGALTEAQLDRAESASSGRFDREAIRKRAAEFGIPIVRASANCHAARLVASLRRDARLDPRLASVLQDQMEQCESAPVPDDLGDVIEWIGASDHQRGLALRDVLRLYDTIARSRDALLPLGVGPPTPPLRQTLERDEQVRLAWDRTPIDLFFSYSELHDACLQRRRR